MTFDSCGVVAACDCKNIFISSHVKMSHCGTRRHVDLKVTKISNIGKLNGF